MVKKYMMSDFINRETGQRFFMVAIERDINQQSGSFKYRGIHYAPDAVDSKLFSNFYSETTLKRIFKSLGTQTLMKEALEWCIKIPFEKGLVPTNEFHDPYALSELLDILKE